MRGVHLFMFIVLIPAILALGHDFYLFTQHANLQKLSEDVASGDRPVRSFFAALGFIWTQYHPESYRWAAQNLEPQQWQIVNEILAQKAVVVGLVFAGFFYAILGLFKILGVWPFRRGSVGDSGFSGRSQKGQFKYKRK